jgi:hypothetical protein
MHLLFYLRYVSDNIHVSNATKRNPNCTFSGLLSVIFRKISKSNFIGFLGNALKTTIPWSSGKLLNADLLVRLFLFLLNKDRQQGAFKARYLSLILKFG